ncbi:MAG: Ni/Fe hydrogenase subunit gamma, partial [Rhodopirellula bahusiensis]
VMMTYAIRAVRERGIPRTNLWLSLERNMNCAIGHCGHCQLGPHFICKDGPVLRYDQVNRLMRVDSL